MKFRNLVLVLAFPVFSFGQTNGNAKTTTAAQNDSGGKRPDLAKISYTDIKWKKSEGNAFWFYYGPTLYFFKDKEFETVPLENGDFMVYVYELDKYLLLPAYINAEKNVEYSVELASARSSVFIRLNRGRFWIFDKGRYVDHLERIGLNSVHQMVYRSQITDKRYWIDESDFSYGPLSVVIGILSE